MGPRPSRCYQYAPHTFNEPPLILPAFALFGKSMWKYFISYSSINWSADCLIVFNVANQLLDNIRDGLSRDGLLPPHLVRSVCFSSIFSLEITHFSHKHISELDRPLICYNIALRYIYIFKLYTANKSTIYFNHECIALSLLACSKMSTAGRN